MPFVRYQAFFQSDDGWGWSEMHHKNFGAPPSNLLAELQSFKALIENYRIPMLARDRSCVGLRVSYGTDAIGVKSSPFRYDTPRFPANQREGCAPHIAAKVRMGETSNTYFSDVYLRGFWDILEEDERLNFASAAGSQWKSFHDQYIAALVAGQYGWVSIDEPTTTRGNVTGYTVQAGGTIAFTVEVVTGPALPLDSKVYKVSIRRLNNSKSVLNRDHLVKVLGATQIETVDVTAATAFQSDGTFIFPSYTFRQYTGSQYTILARKASGRPIGHSPGRAKARPRA